MQVLPKERRNNLQIQNVGGFHTIIYYWTMRMSTLLLLPGTPMRVSLSEPLASINTEVKISTNTWTMLAWMKQKMRVSLRNYIGGKRPRRELLCNKLLRTHSCLFRKLNKAQRTWKRRRNSVKGERNGRQVTEKRQRTSLKQNKVTRRIVCNSRLRLHNAKVQRYLLERILLRFSIEHN
jgi:hypothetical protein